MKLAYYPGCSGQGTSAEYERSTRAVCRALEIGLKEISDWSCCGSTPAHACDHVLSSALSARNLALAAAEGAERVGTPCPSCLANLKTAKYRMQDEAFRDKVNALLDNPCPEELPETVSILQVLVEAWSRPRRHRRKGQEAPRRHQGRLLLRLPDEPPRGHHAV